MKKLLSLSLTLLLVMSALFVFPVNAAQAEIHTTKDGLFEYQITENNDVKLTKYMGSSSTLTIPNKIDNKKVVHIKKIANYSEETSLKKVKILKLNSYVKTVNGEFFWYFSNLKKITVRKNNPKYSSKDGVLYNKDFTKIYAYPHAKEIGLLKLLKTVKVIGNSAFIESDIKMVNIPKTVIKIGPRAFANCQKLKKVIIPKNVIYIGNGSFCNCGRLSKLKIEGSPKLKIDVIAFSGNYSLKTVDLPEFTPTKDSYGAYFEDCPNLTKVIISAKVKLIPGRCFNNCQKLKAIYIPPTVKKIGKYAVGRIWNDALDDYLPNSKFVIKGKKGSAAEKYAKANKLKFKAI